MEQLQGKWAVRGGTLHRKEEGNSEQNEEDTRLRAMGVVLSELRERRRHNRRRVRNNEGGTGIGMTKKRHESEKRERW